MCVVSTRVADTDSCPSGWMLNPCGSLCQRTCEDYLTGSRIACPDICAPPDCVCPRELVVFRDRCVDPLECYSLLTGLTSPFALLVIYLIFLAVIINSVSYNIVTLYGMWSAKYSHKHRDYFHCFLLL